MTDTDVRRIEDKVDNVALVLAELRGSLAPTLDKLTDQQADTEAAVLDHETRIRSLERFRFSVPSAAFLGLIVSLCAGGATLWLALHGG